MKFIQSSTVSKVCCVIESNWFRGRKGLFDGRQIGSASGGNFAFIVYPNLLNGGLEAVSGFLGVWEAFVIVAAIAIKIKAMVTFATATLDNLNHS